MALALYRKYRPRTFAEVIGQEHVTEPLMQALRTGRLHHAYLFSGPRGCGKTSSARILARSLNCERGPTPEPCGECDSCVALAPDGPGSIDVIEIDAASHGGVDDARDLRERAIFAPVSSRFKVYVIDEAHMVSSAGFNALLKLVEEPPEYVKFVFATTEPEKVLGTIKSRTHHYPFRLIPPGVLRPYLEQLAASEKITVEPAVFPLVVRAGGGSARDSLSVLDQLIAGAGPEGVTYAGAAALLGVTDVALIDEMCDALAAGDGAAVFAAVDRVAEAGHDPRRFAADLLERLRDLIILRQVPEAAAKGLLDAPDDELVRMTDQAQRFGLATLSRLADIVHNGLTEMRGTTGPRLLLELICARMLLPAADDSTGALLHRLERMERRLAGAAEVEFAVGPSLATSVPASSSAAVPAPAAAPTGTAALPGSASTGAVAAPGPTPDPAPPPAVAPPITAPASAVGPAPAAPPGVIDAAAVRRVWDEILGYVNRRSPRAAAMARDASPRDVTGDTLVLLFRHTFHANSVSKAPELLAEAVAEVLGDPPGGASWQIRCELAGGGSGPASAGAGPVPQTRAAAPTGSTPANRPRERGPRRPAASEASADDDGDWPESARPGGGLAPSASAGPAGSDPSSGTAGSSAEVGPAGPAHVSQPGAPSEVPSGSPVPRGSSAPAGSGSAGPPELSGPANRAGSDPAGLPVARPARGGPLAGREERPGGSADAGVGANGPGQRATPGQVPATRAATGRVAAARAATKARERAGSAGGVRSAVDEAEEPPYDPDYDPPIRDRSGGGVANAGDGGLDAGYAGFDPGDEPLDDVVDARVARQNAEERGLRLLQQALDAEKIGEVTAT